MAQKNNPPGKKGKQASKSFQKKSAIGSHSNKFLYGFHAVRAAWLNPKRRIVEFYATKDGVAGLRPAMENAKKAEIKRPEPIIMSKAELDSMLPKHAVHQGLVLDPHPLEEVFLSDVMIGSDDHTDVIILDQVTDPRNVGAVLRSAAVFGMKAVIVQKKYAPEITGTLAKAASGAVEHVPMVAVTNLARAMETLKDNSFWVVGMDERGEHTLMEANYGKIALVLGAEGDGLRRLTAEKCDMLVKLPTKGPLSSLNVSTAAAIGMYEISRRDLIAKS